MMFCPGCGKQLPNGSIFCSSCGKQILSNTNKQPSITVSKGLQKPSGNIIYSIDGCRGRHIDVYEDKAVIRVKVNIGSLLTHNATDGEKTIYYVDCIGVQFKKSSLTIGYLQLETASGSMNNKNSNFFGENSFTYEPKQVSNEKMEEVANYIKKQVEKCKRFQKQPQTVIQQNSAADELIKFKNLFDSGVITQEEFDAKKKQLLGL